MTQKSKTELDTLFADNTTGAITPSRLRDSTDSMVTSHGSFYVTSSTATVLPTPGTFVKMAGSTSPVAVNRFTVPVDNRLTYTGTVSVHALIVVNCSVLSSANNQVLRFAVAKNGLILDHSIMETKLTTGSDIDMLVIHADTTLAPNDYLELWCTNTTSTATATADRAYMYVMGMFA